MRSPTMAPNSHAMSWAAPNRRSAFRSRGGARPAPSSAGINKAQSKLDVDQVVVAGHAGELQDGYPVADIAADTQLRLARPPHRRPPPTLRETRHPTRPAHPRPSPPRISPLPPDNVRLARVRGLVSAAEVGGVGGPVAGGVALPGDRDVGVDAQGAGEDRGGDFGGELEQCGAAGLAGPDS